jgi:hypothetical protein
VVEGAAADVSQAIARLQQPAVGEAEFPADMDALRHAPITRRRTITYTESADGKTFCIERSGEGTGLIRGTRRMRRGADGCRVVMAKQPA